MLTLLKNAQVFAPEDLGICHILCGGGRILRISQQKIDAGTAEVVDCEGQKLVPGFIDGHAHITGGGGEAGFSTRVPAPFLSQYTTAGVTTVVGVLGTDDTTRDSRSIIASAYSLREEGIGAFCHTGGYHVPAVTLTGSVRDDIVFLDPVIGVGEIAVSDHRSSQPTLDEILRLAADAHVAGLISGKAGILHLHLGDGQRGLELIRQCLSQSELPPRVFNPTHINRNPQLLDESIELAGSGCYIDATAFPVTDDDDAIPASHAFIRYLDAGGASDRFTISSDGGGCLPVFDAEGRMVHMDVGSARELLNCIKSLLDAGLNLEQILPLVTSNVARLLKFSDRGHIAEGYRADFLLLDKDHEITDVMIHGEWHVRNGQPLRFGKFEIEKTVES